MGMFDYVKFSCKCPNCGEEISGFQSKDSSCLMDEIEFNQVDNFYTSCGKCGAWIEFFLKERPKYTIKDYECMFRERDKDIWHKIVKGKKVKLEEEK
jgi:hypothetical protein